MVFQVAHLYACLSLVCVLARARTRACARCVYVCFVCVCGGCGTSRGVCGWGFRGNQPFSHGVGPYYARLEFNSTGNLHEIVESRSSVQKGYRALPVAILMVVNPLFKQT